MRGERRARCALEQARLHGQRGTVHALEGLQHVPVRFEACGRLGDQKASPLGLGAEEGAVLAFEKEHVDGRGQPGAAEELAARDGRP